MLFESQQTRFHGAVAQFGRAGGGNTHRPCTLVASLFVVVNIDMVIPAQAGIAGRKLGFESS